MTQLTPPCCRYFFSASHRIMENIGADFATHGAAGGDAVTFPRKQWSLDADVFDAATAAAECAVTAADAFYDFGDDRPPGSTTMDVFDTDSAVIAFDVLATAATAASAATFTVFDDAAIYHGVAIDDVVASYDAVASAATAASAAIAKDVSAKTACARAAAAYAIAAANARVAAAISASAAIAVTDAAADARDARAGAVFAVRAVRDASSVLL